MKNSGVIVALMILLLATMFSLANATDYQDTGIRAGEIGTITIDLQGGQTVSGSFNITGSGHQIVFWVRDPTGVIILNSGTVTSPVDFEFTAGKAGTYVLNFDNSNWNYFKHVYAGYDVSGPPILGLDPMVLVAIGIIAGTILAIVAFLFYRRSRASRKPTQSLPPPPQDS